MEIKKIKITNALMKTFVYVKFHNKDDSHLNIELDINKEDIEKYLEQYEKWFKDIHESQPYFSLISNNASNELQVYLHGHNDFKVTCNDLDLRTDYYEQFIGENPEFIFTNLNKK